jgi:hypothetical protein
MTKTRSFYAILMCLALLAAIPAGIRAQNVVTGQVDGAVVDSTGGAVPNARVTIENIATGAVEQPIHTNSTGNFVFPLLKPGSYIVRVSTPNFHTMIAKVEVELGKIESVNFRLEVGAASETVEVSAQEPLLQKENGNLSATVNESQAANIPNPGNDITYVAQITPGTAMNTGGGGYGNFSSFGMSATTNLFTLDGMEDNDPFLNLNNSGATNLSLGQNEIQEVTVVGDGYSGQYGGLAGANVNYITKSGTNRFHGEAIWDWNGSALDANNWFKNATETPKPFVNANQYGADVGGPIWKNKVFFYFDAEGLYLLIPTSDKVLVPSTQFAAAAQANINTTYGATSQISNFYKTMFKLYAGAPGVSRAQNNLPDEGCDGSEVEPIGSGSGTPESTFDVPGGTVFGNMGATTGAPCALSFYSNAGNKTNENLQAWRFDVTLSSHDRLWVRMQHDLGDQASYTDPIDSVFDGVSIQPEWQGQLEESHDFSNGAVNQLILAGQWYSALFTNANQSDTLAAFPTTLQFASGQFANLGGIDIDWPEGRRVSQAQVTDDFAKPFGNHTLKIGVKYRKNWTTDLDYAILSNGFLLPITEDGFFWGGTDPSPVNGAAAGNYSLDYLNSFPTAPEQGFSVWNIGGYLEDDWKIKPNFTLTLAFRGDHSNIFTCPAKCFALGVTEFTSLSTSGDTPYNQLINPAVSNMLPSLTAFEPQPRIGFAWSLHNTVIRGGVGLFYDNYPGALLDNYSENPPLDPSFTTASGTISYKSDPASLLANAAASNAAFEAGFKAGESYNQIAASVPNFSAPTLASAPNYPKVPQYQKWNLEIEHGFSPNTSLSVEYAGNHGIHILDQNNGINGCDYTGTFTSLPACLSTANAGYNPSFGAVNFAESAGVASYNGITASFTHRYKSGQVQINYTYSHTLDDVSNSGEEPYSFTAVGASNESILFPENPFDPQANYGNADQDIRHILTANYVWELPIKKYLFFGHGPDRLLNGWDVNGFVQVRSGLPYTLTDSGTTSSLENGSYDATVFGTVLKAGGANFNCQTLGAMSSIDNSALPNLDDCLNVNDFASSSGGFGNVGRNTLRGPGYWNSDFSIMKHIPIAEGASLVIGAQFYNVFNHPNFQAPVGDVANPEFGQVIGTVSPPTTVFGSFLGADASPRLIQVKLEASF